MAFWQTGTFVQRPIPAGRRVHRVTVKVPKATVPPSQPDGDAANDVETSGAVWQVAIEPATSQALERLAAGTSVGQASHIVTGPYRADVTQSARLTWDDRGRSRLLNIVGGSDPNEQHRELVLLCQEVVQ